MANQFPIKDFAPEMREWDRTPRIVRWAKREWQTVLPIALCLIAIGILLACGVRP